MSHFQELIKHREADRYLTKEQKVALFCTQLFQETRMAREVQDVVDEEIKAMKEMEAEREKYIIKGNPTYNFFRQLLSRSVASTRR
jgi:hypothetical protein